MMLQRALISFAALVLAAATIYGQATPFSEKSRDEKQARLEALILEATSGRTFTQAQLASIRQGVIDLQNCRAIYFNLRNPYLRRGMRPPMTQQSVNYAEARDLVSYLSLEEFQRLLNLLDQNQLLPEEFSVDLEKLYPGGG